MTILTMLAALHLAAFSSTNQAQLDLPGPFEQHAHIVCTERILAINLLSVFEQDREAGEEMLAHLAGVCARVTFSGKPVAKVYPSGSAGGNGKLQFHVYEVDVTRGDVLKGRSKVYMLLIVIPREQA